MSESFESAARWLAAESAKPEFIESLGRLLLEVCAVPTVPGDDVELNAARENAVFDILEKAIKREGLEGRFERRAIDGKIAGHTRYTTPYYTGSAEPYKGRSNLVYVHSPGGRVRGAERKGNAASGGVAYNAHIDTVAPHIPPRIEGTTLFGRGSSDDKGCCVAIAGALALLERYRRATGISPRGNIVSMFVIEEETGGNGSLSLALDREFSALYDTIVIAESTEGQIHPGNRGAIWYKVNLGGETAETTLLALGIVRAFERAGRELRAERSHPLFPAKPVQTCHGILGPYGAHPSRICGEIEFSLEPEGRDGAGAKSELSRRDIGERIDAALERGLAEYLRDYGQRMAPGAKHYELAPDGRGWRLKVFGTTGHMGSSYENDNAITTAAYLVPEAARSVAGLVARLGKPAEGNLVLEGGQGFMPCHDIEEVKEKMRAALQGAVRENAALRNAAPKSAVPELSFDKLHNDAFARDPDSPEVAKAVEAARLVGIPVELPLRGFQASCDARLFAYLHPGKQVITAGPGTIRVAHADDERLDLVELARSAAFYALYAL